MPTKEKLLERHRVCNAYEHDGGETAFLNFTDPSRRKYKSTQGDQASSCSTNTRTKYFLYHVTNLDDVVNHSAVPIVEKRGPWVFKKETRDYVLDFADEEVWRKHARKSRILAGRGVVVMARRADYQSALPWICARHGPSQRTPLTSQLSAPVAHW